MTTLSPSTVDTFSARGIARTRHLTTFARRSRYEHVTTTPISSGRRCRWSVAGLATTQETGWPKDPADLHDPSAVGTSEIACPYHFRIAEPVACDF